MNLRIPAMWDLVKLEILLNICEKSEHLTTLAEVYGALPLVRSGRPLDDLVNVDLDKVREYFRFCREVDIKTDYLFNAVYSEAQLTDKVLDDVKRIVETVEPDEVTISSYPLMESFSETFPEVPIYVSTIVAIKKAEHLDEIDKLRSKGEKIEGFCLHHDSTLDRNLSDMVEAADERMLSMSILVNENCEAECPIRTAHYRFWTSAQRSDGYDACLNTCVTHILEEPWNLVGLAGTIRPEDIDFYQQLGIKNFKIAGRNKTTEWLKKVVTAYANREYEGNLIDILVFTIPPGKTAPELFYVDNSQIRPISERWHQPPDKDSQQEAARLFQEGALQIHDAGSSYAVEDGILRNRLPGDYLKSLRMQEGSCHD